VNNVGIHDHAHSMS